MEENFSRQYLNNKLEFIDKNMTKLYVATTSGNNIYNVNTGHNITSLDNGFPLKIAIPSNSTGYASIKVDSAPVVPAKFPNGNQIYSFKANGIYNFVYYNGNFILISGRMPKHTCAPVSFSTSDLLTGKSANDSFGKKINGNMPNRGMYQNGTLKAVSNYLSLTGFPSGFYGNSNGGKPEIRCSFQSIIKLLGITPAKLAKGFSCFGLTGTAESGSTIYTGTVKSLSNEPHRDHYYWQYYITLPAFPSPPSFIFNAAHNSKLSYDIITILVKSNNGYQYMHRLKGDKYTIAEATPDTKFSDLPMYQNNILNIWPRCDIQDYTFNCTYYVCL